MAKIKENKTAPAEYESKVRGTMYFVGDEDCLFVADKESTPGIAPELIAKYGPVRLMKYVHSYVFYCTLPVSTKRFCRQFVIEAAKFFTHFQNEPWNK